MNGIKCPNCNLVNMMSAKVCHRCQTSLVDIPKTAEVSVPIEETFQAQEFAAQQNVPNSFQQNEFLQDNELGRKTYFWYRIYLAVMTLLYFAVTGFGAFAAYMSQYETSSIKAEELFITGILYSIIGVPLALLFAIGLFLPRKSWSWIVGIIYIALSFTSCCFLPATVPLLIYWLKPETQAYFGRK